MGNKLSCSCGPLKIKGYRYDPSQEPWGQQGGQMQVKFRLLYTCKENRTVSLFLFVFLQSTNCLIKYFLDLMKNKNRRLSLLAPFWARGNSR